MKIFGCLLIVLLLVACSVNQVKLHNQLSPLNNLNVFELKEGITIKANNASASILNAGTKWREIGTINQGSVYRTKDQVVIVNSFNVYEGYIVVKDSKVVGYYLPIEQTFVETKPISINLVEVEKNNEA